MRSELAPRLRGLRRLAPRRWPVRSRIAGVSAAVTFVILIAFALVVGRLVAGQLTNDFHDEVEQSASELAAWVTSQVAGEDRLPPALSDDGVVAIVNASGEVLDTTRPEMSFGPPSPELRTVGDYEVASSPVLTPVVGEPTFVQYARNRSSLDRMIGRLWLFLGGGVLGGTLLAALAALAIARRAMRPISSLTAAAREVASTRDPSRRIPRPESDDEVAELARILDQMLRELDAARADTEHMVQLQREFVADASHELRTPLTSILANLELLEADLERGGADGDRADIVDGALRSSRRMRWLVSDLLLLARADAGRSGIRRPCDLAEIAAAALDEIRAISTEHELAFEADPAVVDGNPEELHRLILNLLENGVRHTPPGTAVAIKVGRRDGDALVEVSDDGPGLPDDLGDQVFARFVRGGDGPADVAGDSGTGLGLAIVKAVAESHGGSVDAGTASSGGALFTVRMPAASPAPSEAPRSPAFRRG